MKHYKIKEDDSGSTVNMNDVNNETKATKAMVVTMK